MTRRSFGALSGSALASLALGACAVETFPADAGAGRLTARPKPKAPAAVPGTRPLALGDARDAVLHIPPNISPAPIPLLVLLHGAASAGEAMLNRLVSSVNAAGVAVLAPDSRGSTWDAVRGGFGPDVLFLDRALARVFDAVPVDPERLAVGGFSDGATYALSIGLVNGDLFRRIVAFSPGFVVPGPPQGKPRVFVSHGRSDEILPIDRCSRVIVPGLKTRGYDVIFREFDGGHEVPEAIATAGMTFITASPAAGSSR